MEIKTLPLADNEQLLATLLEHHSKTHDEDVPPYVPETLSLAAFEHEQFLGGLTGSIVWNHLHISLLGVDPTIRQGGIGSALIKAAESSAREKGCHLMIVETMSWQAPRFYEKNGFTLFGKVTGLPNDNQSKLYLVKYLS
ncbi:GNAT family N-acetyltransferase [Vagococcus sp. BWB3-3]|uniref:GNAT family N-acetyltransferase n=1 Tax=Vagococcus allomyrinae TaxID=2794353 RepID=A0A940SUX8_9ENTE|nr:GNAT family N-acetyltransferase [Vagococcus allomyrinae]MBP1041760.1 GNAT family N-acetyltransferase [Vagococcus allomyrinae]